MKSHRIILTVMHNLNNVLVLQDKLQRKESFLEENLILSNLPNIEDKGLFLGSEWMLYAELDQIYEPVFSEISFKIDTNDVNFLKNQSRVNNSLKRVNDYHSLLFILLYDLLSVCLIFYLNQLLFQILCFEFTWAL